MHLLVHSLLLQPLQNMLKYIPSERQEVLKAQGETRSCVYKSGVTSMRHRCMFLFHQTFASSHESRP